MFRISMIIKACVCLGALAVGNAWGQKVYWADSNSGKVQRADLNGANVEDLVTSGQPLGVAVDYCGGKFYWTDNADKISRANLDGSGAEDLVTTGLLVPQGIALDLVNGKMYWGDSNANVIKRANLDGSSVETVVTGAKSVDVDLDVAAGKVYWGDAGTSSYRRADMNGLDSNVETLVSGISNAAGIALDVAAGKMYYTKSVLNTGGSILRADLNGSNQETLIPTVGVKPEGIALDGAGKMYWTDPSNHKIRRANLDGCGIEEIVTTGLNNPAGITVAPNFANAGNFAIGDDDGDGICDDVDNCPNIPNANQANLDGDALGDACDLCIPGDLDRDGDVDLEDFAIVQRCMSGPNEPGDPGCNTTP